MLYIIGVMALGIMAGYLLRKKRLGNLDGTTTVLIWLLLFLLGVQAGSDERIVRWLASLGAEALIISIGGVIGSSLFAMLLWRWAGGNDRKDRAGE